MSTRAPLASRNRHHQSQPTETKIPAHGENSAGPSQAARSSSAPIQTHYGYVPAFYSTQPVSYAWAWVPVHPAPATYVAPQFVSSTSGAVAGPSAAQPPRDISSAASDSRLHTKRSAKPTRAYDHREPATAIHAPLPVRPHAPAFQYKIQPPTPTPSSSRSSSHRSLASPPPVPTSTPDFFKRRDVLPTPKAPRMSTKPLPESPRPKTVAFAATPIPILYEIRSEEWYSDSDHDDYSDDASSASDSDSVATVEDEPVPEVPHTTLLGADRDPYMFHTMELLGEKLTPKSRRPSHNSFGLANVATPKVNNAKWLP